MQLGMWTLKLGIDTSPKRRHCALIIRDDRIFQCSFHYALSIAHYALKKDCPVNGTARVFVWKCLEFIGWLKLQLLCRGFRLRGCQSGS